jgi:hypothetical protein
VLKKSLRFVSVAALGLGVLVVPAAPASAHEHRDVGDLSMVVGWSGEPTYAGFQNDVQLFLNHHAEGGQEEGPPVEEADVQVEVLFGDQDSDTASEPLTLEPAFDSPGEFLAPIIPSRPGTYTFHFTGDAEGQEIDEFFTSGPDTFSDVAAPTDIQFPEEDPPVGELATALEQTRAENADLAGRAEDAESAAGSARTLAIVGIVAGALGVIVAIAAFVRRRTA